MSHPARAAVTGIDVAKAATGAVKDQLQADKDASIGDRVGIWQ